MTQIEQNRVGAQTVHIANDRAPAQPPHDVALAEDVDRLCAEGARRRGMARPGTGVYRKGNTIWRRWWPRLLLLVALAAATYPAWRWAGLLAIDGTALAAWCGDLAARPPPRESASPPPRLAKESVADQADGSRADARR